MDHDCKQDDGCDGRLIVFLYSAAALFASVSTHTDTVCNNPNYHIMTLYLIIFGYFRWLLYYCSPEVIIKM